MEYNPQQFEAKWREKWLKDKLYAAKGNSPKVKKYILDMFPYPSGDGLHVGHFKLYVASDAISRYYRAKGFDVLHPMGWDAFGLPAENYAIKTGIHPRITTEKNISNIKNQMQMVGFSYDWDREINTSDPSYYKWTQWIFLKLFEKGLAYEATVPINWCPVDKTGLANEEVVNGHCDRCGAKVERKNIRQWMLKITEYADRLLSDLENLQWPEAIKEMQRNWIGKSEGVQVKFKVQNSASYIETFTTRIDTIFGVTAIVVAPEFKELDKLVTSDNYNLVNNYINEVINKSDIERTADKKIKTGHFTGSYATHPFTGDLLPIWVADYVLGDYGTGAVMLVPAHDSRDQQFAQQFNLPIIEVIDGEGKLLNSNKYNGMIIKQAKQVITEDLVMIGAGASSIQYSLRDWVFSRQRYWGEPIPIVHCDSCGVVALPEDQLPLKLPEVDRYQPTGTGESPLAAIEEWVNTSCPKCQGPAKRETNTMPQWAGSCWYYLRFCDPKNQESIIGNQADQYWMPVDWYLGGAEHAVLHLLYARFWHKFLYDLGVVCTSEPFSKLSSVGLVLAEGGQKMSKSKGNVIRPDQIVEEYSADTLRLYEMFMGPFENTIAWDPKSINGVHRFINRTWDLLVNASDSEKPNDQIDASLGVLSEKVASDIELIKLNTAIASMMKWLNQASGQSLTRAQKEKFAIILAPFVPFMTEEIWHLWGHQDSVHSQLWPKMTKSDSHETRPSPVAVQINGKLRGVIRIMPDSSQDEALQAAQNDASIQKYLVGQPIKKIIYVPSKILNVVVG